MRSDFRPHHSHCRTLGDYNSGRFDFEGDDYLACVHRDRISGEAVSRSFAISQAKVESPNLIISALDKKQDEAQT